MRERVLLDVDGVLADFLTPCVAVINEVTGWNKTVRDIRSWHVFRSLDVPPDVEREVYRRMQEPGWCLTLRPIDGAREGVRSLQRSKDVYFVTSPMRGTHWTYERTLWLIEHFGAEWSHVIHCSSKHVCAGDVLIDDKVANLESWQRSHPDGLALKFEGPHNREDLWCNSVASWEEINTLMSTPIELTEDRRWRT